METKKFLVIPFGDGIGDFVMIEPILRFLEEAFPQAEKTILGVHPHELPLIPRGNFKIRSFPGLKFKKYTQFLVQFLPLEAPSTKRALKLPHLLGFFPGYRVVNLLELVAEDSNIEDYPISTMKRVKHFVDLACAGLERMFGRKIRKEARYPRVYLSGDAKTWARNFWEKEDFTGELTVGFNLNSGFMKRWPPANWISLAKTLQGKGTRVIYFEGTDKNLDRKFPSNFPRIKLLPLDKLAAILEQLDVFVSVDSGPLHLASAVGTPWVGIFCCTNPGLTGPYDKRKGEVVVAKNFAYDSVCRSCWRKFFFPNKKTCPHGENSCREAVSFEEVEKAIESLISSHLV